MEDNKMGVYIDNGDGSGFHEGTEADLIEWENRDRDDKKKESEGILDLKSTLVGGAVVGVIAGAIIGGKKLYTNIKEKRKTKKLEEAYRLVQEYEDQHKCMEDSDPEPVDESDDVDSPDEEATE